MFLFLKAIILAIVEGVTEFLPISSTGHLIIVNRWVSFGENLTKVFDIVIQLGAILAVVVFFWPRLWPFSNNKESNLAVWNLWKKTLLGVIPAIILGALLGQVIEEKLFNPTIVALALMIGGLLLIWAEKRNKPPSILTVDNISYKVAFYIGLIQCLAMIPGTSRSAATIIGAMLLGASRLAAAEFSFFLAIPTMVAASGYSLLKHRALLSFSDWAILLVGFVAAFLVAYLVVRVFFKYIQKNNFIPFGYYRIALGVLVLFYFLFK